MVSTGDVAPDFTAPVATGDIDSFTLSENLDDSPLVLAFFPGAFTSVCTHEMNTFEDRLDEFEAAGATVLGASIDTPFALNEFRDQLDLSFDLVSDTNRGVVEDWDLSMDFDALGVENVAKRAVYVVNGDREVVYRWVTDDPGVEPDYDEVVEAVENVS